MRSRLQFSLALTLALGTSACRTDSRKPQLSSATMVLAAENAPAKLRPLLDASPYMFFRFTNREFAGLVCQRLGATDVPVPIVDLHGDAHLGQLSVVGTKFGLVDFDDAARGPVLVDLLRLAVSIEIAGRVELTQGAAEQGVAAMLRGYRDRLDGKPAPPQPRAIDTIIAGHRDAARFADSIFADSPGPAHELTDKLGAGWARYVDAITAHSGLPRWELGVVEWYMVKERGVGSTRTPRFLIRIQGPTEAPDDDVVLEAKALSELRDVPCVDADSSRVVRVIDGFRKFAPSEDPYAAQVPRAPDEPAGMPPWWVHSWRADYSEVDLPVVLREETDLTELSVSTGWLLADGHLAGEPEPARANLSRRLQALVVRRGPYIVAMARELTAVAMNAHAELASARDVK